TLSGSSITIEPCIPGTCTSAGEPFIALDFGTSYTPPALPVCGRLRAWTRFHPELDLCIWDGFAVLPPIRDNTPAIMGANSRTASFDFTMVDLELDPTGEECLNPMACAPAAGPQAIGH